MSTTETATPRGTTTGTTTGTTCRWCTAELDHCHGTLVVHESGLVECELTGCTTLDPARHVVVLDCVEVDVTCICGVILDHELALAS